MEEYNSFRQLLDDVQASPDSDEDYESVWISQSDPDLERQIQDKELLEIELVEPDVQNIIEFVEPHVPNAFEFEDLNEDVNQISLSPIWISSDDDFVPVND